MHTISTKQLAVALKLSKPTSLIDQARKHFGNNAVEKITRGVKLPQGGYSMYMVDIMLTKEQAQFLVSRSRGDTENATKVFNLSVNNHCSLLRNEIFFMGLVDSLLTVTQFKLERQYSCLNYNVDGVIIGGTGVIIIEYNERQHKSNSCRDYLRMQKIKEHFESIDLDVFVVCVDDSSDGIVDSVKKISELIHSDCIGNVLYNDKSKDYFD